MLQQKRPLATFKTKLDSKGQSGPHRPRSLLVPLTAFVIDNQMVLNSRNMLYMSSKAVCYKVSNLSAMPTRIIFMQLLQLFLASNIQDFNLIQRANMGLRDLQCFCIFYEKCAINFDPYSLVLITFGLVFVKSNMISIIHLIVTNIQMWKDLGLSGPAWPFVWV